MRKEQGYTLIEILVVMVIISIVASVAVLSVGRQHTKQIALLAGELTQMITLAEEQAMLQSSAYQLSFNGSEFEFATMQPAAAGKAPQWMPLQDTLLSKCIIPSGMQVEVKVNSVSSHSPIVISTNGDMTPFQIYIGRKGENPSYLITGEADGNVVSKQIS